MPGGRRHRVIHRDNRQRADGVTLGLRLVKLGNFFFQRTTRERYAERAFLERCRAASAGTLFKQPLGAGILTLLVAPDAIVGVIQRALEIGALVGELEAFATAQFLHRKGMRGIALCRFNC